MSKANLQRHLHSIAVHLQFTKNSLSILLTGSWTSTCCIDTPIVFCVVTYTSYLFFLPNMFYYLIRSLTISASQFIPFSSKPILTLPLNMTTSGTMLSCVKQNWRPNWTIIYFTLILFDFRTAPLNIVEERHLPSSRKRGFTRAMNYTIYHVCFYQQISVLQLLYSSMKCILCSTTLADLLSTKQLHWPLQTLNSLTGSSNISHLLFPFYCYMFTQIPHIGLANIATIIFLLLYFSLLSSSLPACGSKVLSILPKWSTGHKPCDRISQASAFWNCKAWCFKAWGTFQSAPVCCTS